MNGGLRACLLVLVLGSAGLFLGLGVVFSHIAGEREYGVTFSPEYASFLGLDPQAVLSETFNDLPIRQIRVPVQWSAIQPQPQAAEFTQLDAILTAAAAHNVKVVLAIGTKVPRWPECFVPDWARELTTAEYDKAVVDYTRLIVSRYRTNPALERWQVENEALFKFGDCPRHDAQLWQREIAEVRALDPAHPIQLTVSGEQQIWASEAGPADVIGTSMYRQVVLPNGWKFTFPIPPLWYTLQALSIAPFVKHVAVSELQAEPWLSQDYRAYTIDQAAALFTPERLASNIGYAKATGLKDISLWGVEWWYYLKQNGHPELWNAAKEDLK